jgi:hypothetical protein
MSARRDLLDDAENAAAGEQRDHHEKQAAQAFGADSNYRQLRAGLHVTGLRTGSVEWSAGAGWAEDTDHHGGAYGKLGVLTQR